MSECGNNKGAFTLEFGNSLDVSDEDQGVKGGGLQMQKEDVPTSVPLYNRLFTTERVQSALK